MQKNKCPVCGHFTYKDYSGRYEEHIKYSEGYKKVTPDCGKCSNCGFFYMQHVKHSLEEQAEKYKKLCSERR